MASIKLATLNINGLTSPTRVAMLEVFFRLQEIDIVLLQEVTQRILDNLHGYTTHYNIRTTRRGKAIVTRDEIQLANMWSSNSRKIPRGMDNKYLCPLRHSTQARTRTDLQQRTGIPATRCTRKHNTWRRLQLYIGKKTLWAFTTTAKR